MFCAETSHPESYIFSLIPRAVGIWCVHAEAEAFAVALVNIKLYQGLPDGLWTFDKYFSLFSNNNLNSPRSEIAFVSLSTSYGSQLPHDTNYDQK